MSKPTTRITSRPRPTRPSNESRRPRPEERRRSARIRLAFETAVPVLVRAGSLVQWGIARNVSEGGMLIELHEPPAIGEHVEVTIAGVQGSLDSPESVVLDGEVRHQLVWNYQGRHELSGMAAIGIRFINVQPEPPPIPGVQ